MGRKFSDRTVVSSLAILLLTEILLLLGHLGALPYVGKSTSHESESPAGQILSAENDLRRRSADSLVWENSSEAEPVYYHDSILTLSQSTAILEFQDGTQIHMAENTLVTVEPGDKDHLGEIRLRFRQGGIRTENPNRDTVVATEDWTLDVRSGSNVELRRTGDEFEVIVQKGLARFAGPTESHEVAADHILKIADASVTMLNVNNQMAWKKNPPARLYTHSESTVADLAWSGHPQQLIHQWGEKGELVRDVSQATSSTETLALGHHTFYLRNGLETSLPFEVQIWKAPLIHLLSPLPRDRVQVGEDIPFLWTFVPGVAGYRIELRGENTFDKTLQENSFRIRFKKEDDVEWGIYGTDRDGYEIPPPYEYPLYIRERPLSAPKLNAPLLRKPAQVPKKDVGWWQWVVPAVEAEEDDDLEAIFHWEPVAGADSYTIEVADAPDFRHPIVTKIENQPTFTWRHFPHQTVYWRVAAASKSGRMGLFSEIAIVNLQNISGESESIDGIQLRKIEKPQPPPVTEASHAPVPVPSPEAEPTPSPPPIAAQKEPTSPEKKSPTHFMLAWRPAFNLATADGDQSARASVKSGSVSGFAGEWRPSLGDGYGLIVDVDESAFKDQPQSPSQTPLQGNISWQEFDARLFWSRTSNPFSFGGVIQQNFGIHRTSPQTVAVKPDVSAGPAAQGRWSFASFQYVGDVAALIGDGEGLASRQQIRWLLRPFAAGAGIDLSWISHSGGSDVSTTAFFLLGFEF